MGTVSTETHKSKHQLHLISSMAKNLSTTLRLIRGNCSLTKRRRVSTNVPKTQVAWAAKADASPNASHYDEHQAINIVSDIPGAKSTRLKNELSKIQEMSTVTFFADYANSLGNYIKDVDGNTYLDCFMQIASIPLGYNHPRILEALRDERNVKAMANRPALGWFPSEDWLTRIRSSMMAVAPPGTSQVFPMMCGTCSNENGIKMMFMRYMHKRRGGRTEFTAEELSTVLKHEAPGSPKLSILSFKGAFHGRTVGLLSCSNSRPIQGVDIPSLNWPKADFPVYKYPLEENVRENEAEDARCLARVEELLVQSSADGAPVAGVISEPIQAEGGDNHGSPAFFRGLADICKRHDISLMMDEVQTGGGATGKMWCHEHFGIEADVVSFSKKMLSGGIYHNLEHRPPHPGRILNTWVGDPHKIIMLEQVVKTIKEESLLDLVTESGETIMAGLEDIQSRYPEILTKARGRGTVCAVDVKNVELRDKILTTLRQRGVHLGGCGESAIRIRPCLTFTPRHANIMLDNINDVLYDISNSA